MKRVLVLLGAYYPAPKANGICAERVIMEMQARDYCVDVVAFAPQWPQSSAQWKDARIEYIRGSMYYRTLRAEETGKLSGKALAMKKKLCRLKDIVFTPSWPDNSKLCTRQFLKKAEEMHRENPYDMVIGVVSPVSALSAAAMFKKRHPEVKMVAYFLDAVSGGVTPRALPQSVGRKLGLRWEKKCCEKADRIIVMQSHEGHHKKYSKQMPYYDRIRILDIPLLCPAEAVTGGEEGSKVHIVYVGSLNAAIRNPDYMLRLAKELPEHVVLDFYGAVNDETLFVPYMGCSQIKIHGQVPHDKALAVQREADFLLNIGNSTSGMVPSKIFEYMSSRKPIITTYRIPDEPSLPYLKRYDACLMLEEREDALQENLQRLLRFVEEFRGRVADTESVLDAFKNNMPDSFVDEIDKLFC